MNKLSVISLVLYMLCSLNVNATETECFWGGKTPWQKMTTVLYNHGVDTVGMSVTTLIQADILNEAEQDLAKTFGVKSELGSTYSEHELIGNVICQYMQLKYTKQNEKHMYYRTRYSTDEDDYAKFIMAYPDSRYADEMQWKMNCMKAYWSWFEAMTEDACRLAYLHSKIVDNNVYEGFAPEYHDIVQYIQTVEDWELLMQARAANKYADCDAFTRFRRAHEGHLTGYTFFIRDSIDNCGHNQAWKAAKEANTIAAYRDYLSSYPAGKHAYEVRRKIRDYEDWTDAREKDNYDAYAKYEESHPNGDSVEIAKGFMRKMEETDWNRIKSSNNWKDFSDYIKKYPGGIYTMQADTKMKAIWNTPDVDMNKMFTIISPSSAKDSGLVFLSNIDNRKHDMTFEFYSMTNGKKRLVLSKTLHPGDYGSYKLKNGTYAVEISSPWNRHRKILESVIPTHGFMSIDNYIYALPYYIYDISDSTLSKEEREKMYTNAQMVEKTQTEALRLVALEMLQSTLDEDAIIENRTYTFFSNGHIDLESTPIEYLKGDKAKESKESFFEFIESSPESSQRTFVALGWAGLGLRVVSKSSVTGKAEVVEFSRDEVRSFARKLEKKLDY